MWKAEKAHWDFMEVRCSVTVQIRIYPFSLWEKVGMRGYKIRKFIAPNYPLTPALSLRERVFLGGCYSATFVDSKIRSALAVTKPSYLPPPGIR